MTPEKILEQAKAAPDKRGLYPHLETIWALRRMGNSYRDIAKFLSEKGIETDHTAVFRLLEEDKPDFNYRDGCVLIGGLLYESRKGRPLRSFGAGLIVTLGKKFQILRQDDSEPDPLNWCEAQFEINHPPNHCWLKQLCKYLGLDWDSENPCHLKGKYGIELKFEGKLMALVCQTSNLEQAMKEVGTAVYNTTQYFAKDKEFFSQMLRLDSDCRQKVVENLKVQPGGSIEDAYDDYSGWLKEKTDELKKRFESYPTH